MAGKKKEAREIEDGNLNNRKFTTVASPYLTKRVLEKMERKGFRHRPNVVDVALTDWVNKEN